MSVSQDDLQQLTQKLTDMVAHSFEEIRTTLIDNKSQQTHEIGALQESLDANALPKGPPGVTKAPVFRGDGSDDAIVFLDNFELYSKFFSWNNERAYHAFPLSLQGNAQIWYATLDKTPITNLNDLIELFKKRFLSSTDTWVLRQQLSQRKQKHNELLADYAADIKRRCQRLKIAPAEQLHFFVNGLRSELRNYVILQQPTTFEEAESQAKIKDSVHETPNNSLTPADALKLATLLDQFKEKPIAKQAVAAFDTPLERRDTRASSTPEQDEIKRMIHNEVQREVRASQNVRSPNPRPVFNNKGDFGRSLRLTNGVVFCRRCGRAGHYERQCRSESTFRNPNFQRPWQSRTQPDRSQFYVRSQNRNNMPRSNSLN